MTMHPSLWLVLVGILLLVGCSVSRNSPPLFPRTEQVFRPDLDPVVTQEKQRRVIQEQVK